MAQTKDMTSGNPVKLILVFALPILAGNILQQLYSLVDSLIIGRILGVTALTAVSASGWLDWAVLSVPMGLAQGYSIHAAQCYGGKQYESLKRTVAQSYLISVAATILLEAASQVMLLCSDPAFAEDVRAEIDIQKASLPRESVVDKALGNSRIIIFDDIDTQIEFANMYAAEHLILAVREPEAAAAKITAAGSIFLGNWSPESAGDYASGTNHTLPTSGLANAWSGLGVESFMHAVTWQQLSREGLAGLSSAIIEMAEAEGLKAHAEAVRKRIYGKN